MEIVKAKRGNTSQFNCLNFWEIEEGEILKYPDIINILLGWGKELKVAIIRMINKIVNKVKY